MAVLSSGYTTSEPILIANEKVWSFIAPEKPDIKITGIKVQQPLLSQITESYGTFKPLGASKTVIVATSIYGVDGSYQITVQGDIAWNSLYTVLVYQGTLQVRDPLGRQKYVRFVDRSWNEYGPIGNLIRDVKVNYFEVDAP